MLHRRHPRTVVVAISFVAFSGMLIGCTTGSSDSSDGTGTTTIATGGAGDDTTSAGSDGTSTTAASPTTTETPTTGGGNGGGGRQAYVDAFTDTLDFGGGEGPFTVDQVDCLANGTLDAIGLDELVSGGVTPEEFADLEGFGGKVDIDDGTANEVFDQYEGCDIDLKQTFLDIAEGFNGKPFTADEQACIDRSLTDDNLRASAVAAIKGEELSDDPIDDIDECLDLTFGPDVDPDRPTANTVVPPPSGN